MKLHSLSYKSFLLFALLGFLATSYSGFLLSWFDIASTTNLFLLALLSFLIFFLVLLRFNAHYKKQINAIHDGMRSLLDHDYSLNLASTGDVDFDELLTTYNALNLQLRDDRQELMQRELMLHSVIQSASTAMILTNTKGKITYSNLAARKLLGAGEKIEGRDLLRCCAHVSSTLEAVSSTGKDGVFDLLIDGEKEIYHLNKHQFALNNQLNYLYLYKQLTREFNRQEVDTWKKVIRVISHELNNSLAPIKSLCHSGKKMAEDYENNEKLLMVLDKVGNRAEHLHQFIDQYAEFARIPKPIISACNWQDLFNSVSGICTFKLVGKLPSDKAWFDTVQIEQVVINLIKNAHESGSAADKVTLQIEQDQEYCWIRIEDHGSGLSAEKLERALLPFYSTKRNGTGLGLPLCREIVEGHGGRLRLLNKEDRGLAAVIRLPIVKPNQE